MYGKPLNFEKDFITRTLEIVNNYHEEYEQLSLFSENEIKKEKEELRKKEIEREKKLQETVINIKNKFGKNSILKGMNYQEGATTKERNKQIGGHKA